MGEVEQQHRRLHRAQGMPYRLADRGGGVQVHLSVQRARHRARCPACNRGHAVVFAGGCEHCGGMGPLGTGGCLDCGLDDDGSAAGRAG